MRDGGDEIGAYGGDGGAGACRARGREQAEREERDPRADDDEAPPRAARRQHERRIAGGTRGDGPGPLREIGRWIDRDQRRVEEQERERARRDRLLPGRVERARDATASFVDHGVGRRAGISCDLRHLLKDVVEVVVARPLEIDGDAEHAVEPFSAYCPRT